MNMRAHHLAWTAPFLVIGCIRGSDVHIRNPIASGAIDPNTIVKTHEHTEDTFGLPRASLDDEARLVSADAQTICIALSLHEIDPITLREMDAKLSAPKAKDVKPSEIREEDPTATTHVGRLPHTEQVGSELSCTKRDDAGNCLSWSEQPTYATTYVPGAVDVHEAKGEVCFPNQGLLTAQTEQLTLEIELRRRAPLDGGRGGWGAWGGGGTSSKDVTFRWGFRPGDGNTAPPAQPATVAQKEPEPVPEPPAEAAPPEAEPAKVPAQKPKAAPAKAAPKQAPPKGQKYVEGAGL
jgi:hypothetical protein